MYPVGWLYAAANRGDSTQLPRVNGGLTCYLRGGKAITKLCPSFLANSVISLPPTNDGGERRLGSMPCSGLGSPSVLHAPCPFCRPTDSTIGTTDIPYLSVASTTRAQRIGSRWKSCPECHCFHPPALASMTLNLLIPCTAHPATPGRHSNPVLEVAHLAQMLVCPAMTEVPQLAFLVSWSIEHMPCRFGVIADHIQPRPTKPPTQRSSVIPS
jgi:hypothetical protein